MGVNQRHQPYSAAMSLLVNYMHEFGRFQRNARLYLISNALSGITIGILLVLYNLYLASLGYNTDFIGLVLFSTTLGAGLAIFPAGFCIDRYGGKLVQIWSNLAIGVIGAAQILFRQPVPLLISGFIAGIAAAFLLVVNAPYLTQNSSSAERPHLFSFNIVVSLGTTVLGEVLGGSLPGWLRSVPWLMMPLPPPVHWLLAQEATPRSFQLALLFAGILAIPSLIPVFMLSDDRPTHQRQAEQGKNFTISTRQSLRNLLVQITYWRKQIHHTPVRVWLNSPFFVLVLVQVLIGLGAGLFIPYFNLYFVEHLKASPALFGLIDGGANALNALLTLLAPLLAMRIGKINTISVTRLLSIPLLLTIGLTSFLPLAALLYLFRQGTMDMAMGIFQVYSMEAIPEQRRGLANSTYQAVSQGTGAITTPLGGVLIAHFSYAPVFIIGAVFYVLSTVLLWARFSREDT